MYCDVYHINNVITQNNRAAEENTYQGNHAHVKLYFK